MLYRCDCKAFDITKNNYRLLYIVSAILYSQCFLSTKLIKNMAIILFEPGGLLDESIIVDSILSYISKYNNEVITTIYIIESNIKDIDSIKIAHDSFYNKFSQYKQLIIEYISFTDLNKIIQSMDFDYVLLLSLDPYEYLYLKYYKNEKENLLLILKQVDFFLEIALFSIYGFFYDVELSFVLYTKNNNENNNFLKYRFFSNNNNFKYSIISYNNYS